MGKTHLTLNFFAKTYDSLYVGHNKIWKDEKFT